MPLLSIITVNYNNSTGLEKTIKSVVSQGFVDYEYIIIDGGSTDSSTNVIKEYQAHIDYWVSEKDKGIYNAMNKGALKSEGVYIYFLNSGDILYHDALQNIFDSIPDILSEDVIYGSIAKEGTGGLLESKAIGEITSELPFCHQAVVVKTDLLKKQLFKENFKAASDYNFFLSLYLKGFKFLQTKIVFGEIDVSGISNTAYFKVMREYVNILYTNSQGINKLTYPINYLWKKKKFIGYVLLKRILGASGYKKLIGLIR